jgi:hypothetical protein
VRPQIDSSKVFVKNKLHPFHPDFALPLPYEAAKLSPDLADVMSAWPDLPEAIRAGIMAMVRASKPTA